MKANVSGYIVGLLVSNGTIQDRERECYEYCVNATLEMGGFILATMFVGLALGRLPQTVLFLAGMFSLKSYVGGYHANTTVGCFLLSMGTYLVSIFTSDWLYGLVDYKWNVFVFGFCIILAFYLAPVDCENKRLDKEEYLAAKRTCRKILLVHCVVFALLLVTPCKSLCFVYSTSFVVITLSMLVGIFKNRGSLKA